jgi:hypothetical protein
MPTKAFVSSLDKLSIGYARLIPTSPKSKTRFLASLLMLIPGFATQTPTKIPVVPVPYIELLPQLSTEFPNRTKPALEAAHQAQMEAAQALEAKRQADIAAQAAQVAYRASVAATNNYKLFIYNHESGNNSYAINPYSGACGLGQALPCSKMGCSLSDYICQDNWFTAYALERYGSWYGAYIFWLAHRWW